MNLGNAPEAYSTAYEMSRYKIKDGARHLVDYKTFLGHIVYSQRVVKRVGGVIPKHLDDNDGVKFATPLEAGKTAIVDIEASTHGYLSAWMDFNIKGNFEDVRDQIFQDKYLSPGLNRLQFKIPPDSKQGDIYLRFRFSTITGLSYKGFAPDGEVEDYKVTLK